MSDTYTPRHRANKSTRTKPTVQPVPKHAGEYVPEDRTHERLGAGAFAVAPFNRLLFDIGVGNPFGRGVRS